MRRCRIMHAVVLEAGLPPGLQAIKPQGALNTNHIIIARKHNLHAKGPSLLFTQHQSFLLLDLVGRFVQVSKLAPILFRAPPQTEQHVVTNTGEIFQLPALGGKHRYSAGVLASEAACKPALVGFKTSQELGAPIEFLQYLPWEVAQKGEIRLVGILKQDP